MSAVSQMVLLGMNGGVAPATFITTQKFSGSTASLSLTGYAAGDLGIVVAEDNNAPTISTTNTWTNFISATSTSSFLFRGWYRVLQAGDTNPTVTMPNGYGAAFLLVYRGASLVTLKTQNLSSTSGSVAISGFAPAANSTGVVGWCASRPQATISVVPTGFTSRNTVSSNGTGNWYYSVSDRLSGYTNSTSTFTNTGTTDGVGFLMELTQ